MGPMAVQATMNRHTAAAVHGTVLAATLGFSIAHQTATSFILLLAASIAAWLLVDAPVRSKPIYLPAWVLNVVVIIGAGYLSVEMAADLRGGSRSVIISLAHFILVLMACKFFERRTRRDVTQVIMLAFLIIIAGALYSSSGIGFTLALLAFLAAMIYGAGALYLRDEAAPRSPRRPASATLGDGAGTPRLTRDLRVVAKICALLSLGPALLFFLAAPRTHPRTLAAWGLGQMQTGYSEEVQFRDSGTLVQSDTEVMTVRISSGGQPVGSLYDEPYFRGSVQEDYLAGTDRYGNGVGRWREYGDAVATSELVNAPTAGDHTAATPFENEHIQAGDILQEYRMFEPKGQTMFCLATPVAFGSPRIDQVLFFSGQARIRKPGPYAAAGDYTVYSRPNYAPADATADPFITPGALQHKSADTALDSTEPLRLRRPSFTPLIEVPEKIMTLARSLAAGYLTTDYDGNAAPTNLPAVRDPRNIEPVLRLFENYLRANYPYSLTIRQVDPSLDPTTDFILNRKTTGGYCEFFASAQVMLCRAVGINARMVTGYRGGEYNSLNGEYIVRERDAHAWAETYIPGSGWTLSDPTPSQTDLKSSESAISIWLRDLSQYVQNAWLTSVASFDDDSQRSMGQWLAAQWQYLATLLQDAPHITRIALWDGMVGASIRWILGGTLLGFALLLAWVAGRWYGARAHISGNHSQCYRHAPRAGGELAFLDELMHLLERSGPHRGIYQTPREFAECLRGKLGAAFEDVAALIDVAYGIRFGGVHLNSAGRRRVAEALARVRTMLRPHARLGA